MLYEQQKNMTALEYNILNFHDKQRLLRDYGLFLDEKIVESRKIRVYALGDFFVEEGVQIDNDSQYFRALESLLDSDQYIDPLHVFHLN